LVLLFAVLLRNFGNMILNLFTVLDVYGLKNIFSGQIGVYKVIDSLRAVLNNFVRFCIIMCVGERLYATHNRATYENESRWLILIGITIASLALSIYIKFNTSINTLPPVTSAGSVLLLEAIVFPFYYFLFRLNKKYQDNGYESKLTLSEKYQIKVISNRLVNRKFELIILQENVKLITKSLHLLGWMILFQILTTGFILPFMCFWDMSSYFMPYFNFSYALRSFASAYAIHKFGEDIPEIKYIFKFKKTIIIKIQSKGV
uniref:7TM_GPCR_Srx domain-containing protein n=1 Tax=Rhabditophanes sp. KR3021 TaxID=114890 RepID=A0AC35TQB0_9BILA